ncbi:uncharacterized protein NECHADRAFT_95968 [Fusarium vanettenii 77-13-4]|uniref:Zn(2)-C6 fungal-type domain-containing protein n=1 Tax=Fusarium vanettenii (strain ATCC MYA-4622 / CBS 123669 / FGSC 9596 / NRRL 45880 / 77-13-4) TaxID=660122 RepID=C7ZD35_FUSV7|nr:uncharacterized protein NECHADRAFT_95968 [Fusarium vanettenii 77-13-4]EEU38152.1 hypothetical protein NECHADRAFT_95968 [Fusarium vanettenii 77-13-4]
MDSAKRKRAAKACNYCRKRKRKCDGRQPVCSLCEEANNSECEYRDETARRIAVEVDRVDEIFSRLETLESTFRHAIAVRRDRSPVSTPHTLPRHGEAISPENAAASVPSTADRPGTASLSHFANNNVFNTTMDIPLSHSSTTGNLLRSAPAKALLGHYPADLFLHIELRRPIPDDLQLIPVPTNQINLPTLQPDETDILVRNFFRLVHHFHPILDQRAFHDLYNRTIDDGLRPDLASALVLVVLALGAVAAATPNLSEPSWHPGIQYFTPAVRLLLAESLCSFGGNPILPQALYLAALYYSWSIWHLQMCNIIGSANSWSALKSCYETAKADHKISPSSESFGQFLFLNDTDSPGIEKIVDKLPYPWSDGPSEPYMHRWLADLSSRRLLNRIHYVLYAGAEPGTGGDGAAEHSADESLPNLANELNHQLGGWYHLLPHSIRPNLDNPPSGADDTMVTIRYHTTGDIIFRPFLYQCDFA